MLAIIKEKIRINIPIASQVLFVLALISAIIHILFINFTTFADFFNRYVSSVFRMIFAKLTAWIPFSLAEAFVIFIPVTLVAVVAWAFRRVKISDAAGNRSIFTLLSAIAFLYSVFVLNFAAGYSTSELDVKLGLERRKLSADDLAYACSYLSNELEQLEAQIVFEYGGLSLMPYSNGEMIDKLNDAYEKGYEKYPFISELDAPVKQVMLSEPMTYTHISGVYSFFSGEANINVNYPDFVLPFTAAHEMAHQRGIARENEANFIAYLICMESDDPYIRYSATLNMYEYVSSALSSADKSEYSVSFSALPQSVRNELYAYSDFFDKYRDSVASEVSETINNTYLTVQGTEGTKSYGMVVDLFVAYLGAK